MASALLGEKQRAAASAQGALSAARVAHAWPEAPRVVASFELLPERALAGLLADGLVATDDGGATYRLP